MTFEIMVNFAFFQLSLYTSNIYGKKAQFFWVVCLSFHFYDMQSQLQPAWQCLIQSISSYHQK